MTLNAPTMLLLSLTSYDNIYGLVVLLPKHLWTHRGKYIMVFSNILLPVQLYVFSENEAL